MEWARGQTVILLKVSVFNQVTVFSSPSLWQECIALACRGRSERNRAQRGELNKVEVAGELFRNVLLACKVQRIINENVSLKRGVHFFFYYFPVVD